MKKQAGVKLDARHWAIVYTAIEMDLGEDVSQIVRLALREFSKNHGIEVNKNE